MRAVNLLPRDAAKQRKSISQQNVPVLVAAGLGVVVVGGLGLAFMHESGAVSSAQRALIDAKAELARTPKPPELKPPPVDPNAALAGQQAARLSAVTTALGARFAWDRVLRELSQVLPDDVTVSSLSLQTPDAAAGATAPSGGVSLVGSTFSHDSVARLLARLALIPELADVTLQTDTSAAAAAGVDAAPAAPAAGAPIQFTISATVKLPAGATSLVAPPPAPPPPAPADTTETGASS